MMNESVGDRSHSYAGHTLSGIPVRYIRTVMPDIIPDNVGRKKLTCQVAFGDLTTFKNLIRSTGHESKPDECLEVSSDIPEQVSVINFVIEMELNFNVTFY